MSDIKLLRLELKDFKGIPHFLFEPQGSSATVEGPNACGKSTLMTAFLWLLSGKDAQGRENYQIFPLREDGSRVTGCSPTVEAEITTGNGLVVLTRQMVEKWSKTRGAAAAEYRGDETKCTIDETPTAITKYAAWVDENICPAELLPLLLNVSWFSEQTKDYQQRRSLLLKQFGALSEAEILASDEELQPLSAAIGRHSVEEFRKILLDRRRRYAAEIETIPARIDENRKQLATDLPSEDEARRERSRLEVQIRKTMRDLEMSDASSAQSDAEEEQERLKKELASVDIQRNLFQRESERDFVAAHTKKLEQLAQERRYAEEDQYQAKCELAQSKREADALNADLDALRARWVSINGEEAQIQDTCPTCGQPLPPEAVQSALESWNLQKSEKLDRILQQADEKKRRLEILQRQIEEQTQKLQAATAHAERALKAYQMEEGRKPPETKLSPILEDLEARKADIIQRMEEIAKVIISGKDAAEQANQALRDQLRRLQDKSDALAASLASIAANAQTEGRISELEQQQKGALADLEETEQLLALCQLYTRVMVSRLTERINQHFITVRFKLFEEQKNGGLKEVCEATVDGVPYGSLNTAAKMQANVEIVSAFSQAAGVSLPLILDNRESVQRVHAPNGLQIINLQVAPIDRIAWHKI